MGSAIILLFLFILVVALILTPSPLHITLIFVNLLPLLVLLIRNWDLVEKCWGRLKIKIPRIINSRLSKMNFKLGGNSKSADDEAIFGDTGNDDNSVGDNGAGDDGVGEPSVDAPEPSNELAPGIASDSADNSQQCIIPPQNRAPWNHPHYSPETREFLMRRNAHLNPEVELPPSLRGILPGASLRECYNRAREQSMTVDEASALLVKARNREKQAIDASISRGVNYFEYFYKDDLDYAEKRVWWENDF